MITVKNSALSQEVLTILNSLVDSNINASLAFRLARIVKELSPIAEDKFKTEKKIYDKWVVKDENGNPVHPKDDEGNDIKHAVQISNIEEFTKEMNEFMEIENVINQEKIDFEKLGLETFKAKDLLKIDFLFN